MPLQGDLGNVKHTVVRGEERCDSYAHIRRRADLVPVVSWQEETVTRQDLDCFHSSVREERKLLVVWSHELDWRVVIGPAIVTGVNILSVVLWNDREILVASIDAHHILHSVSVRSGQCPEPMPIRHDVNLHELVHKSGQLNVIF